MWGFMSVVFSNHLLHLMRWNVNNMCFLFPRKHELFSGKWFEYVIHVPLVWGIAQTDNAKVKIVDETPDLHVNTVLNGLHINKPSLSAQFLRCTQQKAAELNRISCRAYLVHHLNSTIKYDTAAKQPDERLRVQWRSQYVRRLPTTCSLIYSARGWESRSVSPLIVE
jgi:hypothetical protein